MLLRMVLYADVMNIAEYQKMHNTKFWKSYFLPVKALILPK